MYRRPKFLEILLEIRREMALESDYDVDLFVENVRKGNSQVNGKLLLETQPASEVLDGDPEILPAGKQRREVSKR
jgi:hypothetical protein